MSTLIMQRLPVLPRTSSRRASSLLSRPHCVGVTVLLVLVGLVLGLTLVPRKPLADIHHQLSLAALRLSSGGQSTHGDQRNITLYFNEGTKSFCPAKSSACNVRVEVPESVPPWPEPEIAYVAFNMQKHYQRLDNKAHKECKLQRDTEGVQWNNHSNYDVLTRWKNPGIPGAAFDHTISFRYKKVPGVRPRLENFQCRLLLRGQDYSALRKSALVQAHPFKDRAVSRGAVDEGLQLVAVVFPQFHAFKENDLFWGTNFTEWTNLKMAFFNPWNFQPIKHPLREHGGYYNLLDLEHRKRVGKLAKAYGIQTLAYHHYWFNCETIFLEQAVLRMTIDGDPDLNFMLIWANEAWTRHWTGETGEVLQPQGYGNETCWTAHFNWLLPLFKHPNHLRVDGKPVFAIYIVPLVKRLPEMLALWRELALEAGLPGLHIVQCLGHKDKKVSPHVDAIFEYQPNLRKGKMKFKSLDQRLHDVHYRGEYLGWDNYPRHNLDPRFIVGDLDDDPIHVESRLYSRMKVARDDPNNSSNLFFLIAWNEWGEGNILEPNNVFGYGNLNAVASAYVRSRHNETIDMDLLKHLLEVMEECKLKLDAEFYIDLARTELDHLLDGPEPEIRIIENWENKGFSKGREFRLVPDVADDNLLPIMPHCRQLSGMVLDKTVVRYYLEIENSQKVETA